MYLSTETQGHHQMQRPSTRSTMVQPSANSNAGTNINNNQSSDISSPTRGPRANAATRSSPRKTSAVRWLRAVVGQASEPTTFTEQNQTSRSHEQHQNVDDNGNTRQQATERDHTHHNQEEDICSCSLAKDNNIRTISSSLNNNGNGINLSKGGLLGKNHSSTSTSPYILSLSTSRQHSNHHVLT